MKAFLKAFPLLAVVAMGSVALAEDTYTIRRTLTEGEKTKYTIQSVMDGKLDLSAFGQGSMDLSVKSGMTLLMVIEKVKDGKATFSGKVTDHTLEMEPAPPGDSVPKEFSVKGSLTDRNDVSDIKFEGLTGMSKMMTEGSMQGILRSLVLPEKAVKIGESWEQPKTVKLPSGSIDSDVKATLVAVEKKDDKEFYKISLKGKAKTVGEVGAEEGGGMGMGKMKSTSDSTIDAIVMLDKATGKLISMTNSGDISVATEMVDMGMTIPMSGKMTMKVEIAK